MNKLKFALTRNFFVAFTAAGLFSCASMANSPTASAPTPTTPAAEAPARCRLCKELRTAREGLLPAKPMDDQIEQVVQANDTLFDISVATAWNDGSDDLKEELSDEYLKLAIEVSEIDSSDAGLEAFESVYRDKKEFFKKSLAKFDKKRASNFLKKLKAFDARSADEAKEAELVGKKIPGKK